MAIPRILMVTEQREVARMLRSSLEHSGRSCVIVDVPTGEEAALELLRAPVDLLVSDMVLPGVSGLDLMADVRRLNPHARAIMITERLAEREREAAVALGAVAFLPRPIKTSFFLEAVDRALQLAQPPEAPVHVAGEGRAGIAARLVRLLGDLGARAVYLIDDAGRMVVQAGELGEVDLKGALAPMQTALRAGLQASNAFGAFLPGNVHYIDGDLYDVYLTNVGAFYGLLIVFDGAQGVETMPLVLQHARSAAQDLLSALSRLGPARPAERRSEPAPDPSAPASPTDAFWDQAAAEHGRKGARGDALSFDQARALGLVPDTGEE